MRKDPRPLFWLAIIALGGVGVIGQTPADPYRPVAEQYVKLVLAVGQHDADYVDAFYGPAEWRKEAEAAKKPLAEIDAEAAEVEKQFAAEGAVVIKKSPKEFGAFMAGESKRWAELIAKTGITTD